MAACFFAFEIRATDQVEMMNGDRYVGQVVSLNQQTLVLTNELLGTVTLPRGKVAGISFNSGPKAPPALINTNRSAEPNSLAAKLGSNSNLLAKVQKEFLSGADVEAQNKFNELVSGLLNGSINADDVRAMAKSTADQVRASRKDLGDSGGWALDGYLAILDQFVRENPPPEKAATNSPPKTTKP